MSNFECVWNTCCQISSCEHHTLYVIFSGSSSNVYQAQYNPSGHFREWLCNATSPANTFIYLVATVFGLKSTASFSYWSTATNRPALVARVMCTSSWSTSWGDIRGLKLTWLWVAGFWGTGRAAVAAGVTVGGTATAGTEPTATSYITVGLLCKQKASLPKSHNGNYATSMQPHISL